MKQSYAEDLEWVRLRVAVAAERVASAGCVEPHDKSSAHNLLDAKTELRRATLCLRAHAAQALRIHANPLFWHDRFGQPRDMTERAYQLSA